MKFLITILTLVLLAGCKTPQFVLPTIKHVVKDSIVFKTDTLYRKDTLKLPGDTLEIGFAIPCPQAKNISLTKAKGRTQLTVKSDSQGNFYINCKTDSLIHVIDSLYNVIVQKESYHSDVQTVTVTKVETVTKYKVPKWCWWLLLICIGYLAYKFRKPIGSLFFKLINKV